jgi:hypothetical protein
MKFYQFIDAIQEQFVFNIRRDRGLMHKLAERWNKSHTHENCTWDAYAFEFGASEPIRFANYDFPMGKSLQQAQEWAKTNQPDRYFDIFVVAVDHTEHA